MCWYSFFILVLFQTVLCGNSVLVESDIYFQASTLDLKAINISLAASLPLERDRYRLAAGADVTLSLAMAICQADRLNQKKYPPIDFDGIINIVVQSHDDRTGQYATMELYQNNLYNATTNKKLSQEGIDNIFGYFGSPNSGDNRINSAIVDSSGFGFINPGNIDQIDLEDKFYLSTEKFTFFSIWNTEVYTPLNVILDLMKTYNWTIAANVFQDDSYGFASRDLIQSYSARNSWPIFTCNKILTARDGLSQDFISTLCDCMGNINTLTVLNLWVSEGLGYDIIYIMRNSGKCPIASKIVFILTSTSSRATPVVYKNPEYFKYTLVIRSYGLLDTKQYLDDCLEMATPQGKAQVVDLLDNYYKNKFNCVLRSSQNGTLLPDCNKIDLNQTDYCTCTGLELDPYNNDFSSQTFFYADTINVYAEALRMAQQNCTYATDYYKVFFGEAEAELGSDSDAFFDFCNITTFTPLILTKYMRIVNFTGYTGRISFPAPSRGVRAVKPFYLYNIQDDINNLVYIGTFNYDGFTINQSAIMLPSGNNTVSELVPSNPNLTDAAIAAFFGLTVFLLVLTLLAFVILIYNFNHPVIRKNTPMMSLVVLIGVLLVLIGAVIICMGTYDATCLIFNYCIILGQALIIAAIIAKSYRIYRIFKNTDAVAVVIKDTFLFGIVLVILFYFLLIGVAMTICGYGAYILESSTNKFYLYYACTIDDSTGYLILTLFFEISMFLLRILALYLAWRTRKVGSIYGESYGVLVVVSSFICLNVCFIPLYYSLRNGTDSAVYQLVINLIYLDLITAVTLILLFYARFYEIYKYNKKRANAANSSNNRDGRTDYISVPNINR